MSAIASLAKGLGYWADGMAMIFEAMGKMIVFQPVESQKKHFSEPFLRSQSTEVEKEPVLSGMEKDWNALASDWKKLGQDMEIAIGKYVNGQ